MTSSVGRATRPKNHYRPQTKNGRGRLEALRQNVARLNIKAGKAILFANLAKRWLDIVSGMMEPSSRLRRDADRIAPALRYFIGDKPVIQGSVVRQNF
jgi:hypothetical protein